MKRKGRIVLAVSMGVICIILCLIWTVLGYLFLMAMTLGDGATGFGPWDAIALGLPSIYLLLIAFSCLPLVRGWLLTVTGAIAHALLLSGFWLTFHHERIGPSASLLLGIPFVLVAAGWIALWHSKARTSSESPCM